jgi:hypothetical protein
MSVSDIATYYMVEMDYPHETAAQRETFDAYYWRHIDMLLTIPGFMTAQRFYCADTDRAPFLALYRLAGPDVLTSEAYTSKAGRMSVHPDFRAYISGWDRNLVQGPAGSGGPDLATAMGDTMTLIDRLTPNSRPLPGGIVPLEVIGLDRTIVQRGVVGDGAAYPPQPAEGWSVRVWQPIHALRRPD